MLLFDAFLVPFVKPPASKGGSVLAHIHALVRSRKAARVAVMGACVLLYVKLRAWIAVSHLVSIYRKVREATQCDAFPSAKPDVLPMLVT